MTRFLRIAVLLLPAAGLLASCAVFGGPRDRAIRRTPSFQQGYADGCARRQRCRRRTGAKDPHTGGHL